MTDTTSRPTTTVDSGAAADAADAAASATSATSAPAAEPLQPFLAAETVVLKAPAQAWSDSTGAMGGAAIHGVWVGDTRVLRGHRVEVGGSRVETIASVPLGASSIRFESLLRGLDDHGADPDVRLSLLREIGTGGVRETLTATSRLARELDVVVSVVVRPDASSMDEVKAGLPAVPPRDVQVDGARASWSGGDAVTTLTTTGSGSAAGGADDGGTTGSEDAGGAAQVEATADGELRLTWHLRVPARGAASAGLELATVLDGAVVAGVEGDQRWGALDPAPRDDRLARWLDQALGDLSALRMTTADRPDDVFFAAGAPWFFTLFGRDSLWAARLALPLDPDLRTGLGVAAGTLRVLAGLQGTHEVAASAEQPGKIMHELRQRPLEIHGEGVTLAPLYYGTVDATALWVCLLHDAWRAGLPDDEVQVLLPHLEAALAWMRDHGDSDGDGLLEYVDETGHGLSNQGWKDSGDSVQWSDGRLADGPIALCEVQAYAHEAAVHGADLLDAFDRPGADEWRGWADRLRTAFRERFWVTDARGRFPAVALDADKRAVDTVTSNIGHLLGTGLLDADEEALVAARLVDPSLASGFGLRTLSSDAAGFWPLGYHLGTVWTHDTAVAIGGLAATHHHEEARLLSEGLLAAAPWFGYRMPELHGGDAAADVPAPVPYPASCRPQAWSAAAAVAVWAATSRACACGDAGGA
ncbi:amylo-alpha-1,6-glucosidase [Frigoribacterium sp. CFBP 13729]|uniref:MGH1-like glycoside hydrolase domain-containing protein n=1 Tax=Frigoribacterium sp. CFBP 13729 TaxID=2775293 RepID=UPI00178333A5|nr:glycogen debranching N-terminal domain-containing protein [Frigoribacterium sp. CFBP 13729]MBD8610043.1 amylo-alpha-1,6-glucosidase [Frigoribacterium sp. CFBP 13729]